MPIAQDAVASGPLSGTVTALRTDGLGKPRGLGWFAKKAKGLKVHLRGQK